jgi:ADP-heptose:LPS heptosyltransferase
VLFRSEATGFYRLRTEKYDGAVVMFYTTEIGALLKKARIPVRIGPLSKLSSFYYLNAGIRQHRSACKKNEAEYNLDLLKPHWPRLSSARPRIFYQGELSGLSLPQEYVLVAPQSHGSALNVSEELYEKMIRYLAERVPVVLTGLRYCPLGERLAKSNSRVINVCGKTSLDQLVAVIEGACFVIAPSSGTVHLANAMGKKIISFYPPALVMSPRRWAPLGYEGKIFVSKIKCGKHCRKSTGCGIGCMDFNWDEVAAALDALCASAGK